jgi:repressor LexA
MEHNVKEKEQQILDFIIRHVNEKGYPPSVREICKGVGFKSTSTVHTYLRRLERHGFLKKDPAKPRALKIIKNEAVNYDKNIIGSHYSAKEMVNIPVVGKVTAGQPILAVENIEDTFPMPVDVVNNADAFMLKVKGESMIEAGILNNDLILVRQQSTAVNGDIVVALIGDEATVKTFYKEKGYIRLQPENQHMEPIIVNDDMSIIGKVIGVFRKL